MWSCPIYFAIRPPLKVNLVPEFAADLSLCLPSQSLTEGVLAIFPSVIATAGLRVFLELQCDMFFLLIGGGGALQRPAFSFVWLDSASSDTPAALRKPL